MHLLAVRSAAPSVPHLGMGPPELAINCRAIDDGEFIRNRSPECDDWSCGRRYRLFRRDGWRQPACMLGFSCDRAGFGLPHYSRSCRARPATVNEAGAIEHLNDLERFVIGGRTPAQGRFRRRTNFYNSWRKGAEQCWPSPKGMFLMLCTLAKLSAPRGSIEVSRFRTQRSIG